MASHWPTWCVKEAIWEWIASEPSISPYGHQTHLHKRPGYTCSSNGTVQLSVDKLISLIESRYRERNKKSFLAEKFQWQNQNQTQQSPHQVSKCFVCRWFTCCYSVDSLEDSYFSLVLAFNLSIRNVPKFVHKLWIDDSLYL